MVCCSPQLTDGIVMSARIVWVDQPSSWIRRFETRVFEDILTGLGDEIDDAAADSFFLINSPPGDALEAHASRGAMVGIDREQHRFEHAIRCDLVDESDALEFVT